MPGSFAAKTVKGHVYLVLPIHGTVGQAVLFAGGQCAIANILAPALDLAGWLPLPG